MIGDPEWERARALGYTNPVEMYVNERNKAEQAAREERARVRSRVQSEIDRRLKGVGGGINMRANRGASWIPPENAEETARRQDELDQRRARAVRR